jgi:hypothetical protein
MIILDNNFFQLQDYEGEYENDGYIEIFVPCSCGKEAILCTTLNDLIALTNALKKALPAD